MRGSLAVWCMTSAKTPNGEPISPEVETHFNIWSGLPKKHPDTLDIGFLFPGGQTIDRLFLYIPGQIERTYLSDLSTVLKDRKTLSAVFNETLEVGIATPASYEVTREGRPEFQVIHVDCDNPDHVSIRYLDEENNQIGSVVTFENAIMRQVAANRPHYIRVRIRLYGVLRDIFVSSARPRDWVFLSSFYRTQLVEFRLNEKRNFSSSLRALQTASVSLKIAKVQYFLVRDLSVEIVQSHANFRKMRRLESGLWDGYLDGLGGPKPESMIIYHWRAPAQPATGNYVEDFIALTGFRQPRPNIWIFMLAIVLLGAAGSATQSLLTALVSPHVGSSIWVQIFVILIIGLLLGLLFLGSRR